MAKTYQNVIDAARNALNDPATATSQAYTDAELLGYVEEGLFLLERFRPDLFVGLFSSLPTGITASENIHVPDSYFPALVSYTVGKAESKDDEHILRERAALFFSLFSSSATRGIPAGRSA